MTKRLLLLGGTAFFGKHIGQLFHDAGYEVTLFTRGNVLPPDLPPHRHIRGDRRQKNDLARAAGDGRWDVVIDNIAYTGEDVSLALDAFRDVGRFVLCSTVSVYRFVRDRFPQPLHEDAVDYDYRPGNEDPTDVHWSYARGKLEAERTLIDRAEVPWTILRPPVVYGPWDPTDRGFWYLARLLDKNPILLADSGNMSFRVAFSEDVARAFHDVTTTAATVGHAYNVVQSEIFTLRQFLDESAISLGVKPDWVSVPSDVLGSLGGPWAAPIMVNFVPDGTAAARDFNFRPTPCQEWIASTAKWFRDHWKGDSAKLLSTRREETELARRFREATGPLKISSHS